VSLGALRYIEIETSRLCNRVCPWCPNSTTGSRREQELLPWPLLERAVTALGEAEYEGWVALHNYNEPLANPRLGEEIALVRARAPRARISIVTNGDYLSPGRCHELEAAGVSYLRVTRYPARDGEAPSAATTARWLHGSGLAALGGWQPRFAAGSGDHVVTTTVGIMSIDVISPDVSGYNSRGGLLPEWNGTRAAPCEWTTYYAAIDYRGRVKMCCNIYSDAPEHSGYIVGSLADAALGELLASPRLGDWSRRHLQADWSQSPVCATCRHRFRMVPEPAEGTEVALLT